ncbi:MAG: hypothetical protein ACRD6N_03650 [Pyrinomonadaceae bacterium]
MRSRTSYGGNTLRHVAACLLAVALFSVVVPGALARLVTQSADKPFVVEYYYKAKWGYADEFIRLFKKNHYPVLKKEKDLGRILKVTASSPRYHTTEEGRWDYRVTIVWKNVGVTNDGFDAQPLIRQLFPDQETFKREEQRRFEILAGHWDVPVADVDLEK